MTDGVVEMGMPDVVEVVETVECEGLEEWLGEEVDIVEPSVV